MYQFIDRPVCALSPGSRLMLWAARGWAHARASGTCPPGAIAPAFLQCGAIAVLPDVHRFFQVMEGGGGDRLALPPLGHPRVDDIEAVFLQLWSDALARPHRAYATLMLMLADEDAGGRDLAESAFAALGKVAVFLLGKGMPPDGLAATSAAGA